MTCQGRDPVVLKMLEALGLTGLDVVSWELIAHVGDVMRLRVEVLADRSNVEKLAACLNDHLEFVAVERDKEADDTAPDGA